eukprot:TRINITY_DN711_c0_g1_i1.p1 TRINITY_DN711_c0_g1~~TRINITY_DN711_c0_g1_i1.p1  ORF type:complete len:417 (-),score=93.46 TRINITY_DN711_c0_g1_i1:60-1247(-)
MSQTLERRQLGVSFKIFGAQLSYFTRKLHVALHLTNLPYQYVPRGLSNADNLAHRAGTQQIPVLETPEGWLLTDTSPILAYLDSLLPEPLFYPSSIIGLVSAILEEYFDEWLSRQAVCYRWTYDEDRKLCAEKLAREYCYELDSKKPEDPEQFNAISDTIQNWGKRAVRAVGISENDQKMAAEKCLYRIYQILDEHFKRTSSHLDLNSDSFPFIFGSSPTALDTMVWGGLKGHFFHDPTPKKQFQDFKYLWKWFETIDADLSSATPKLVYGRFKKINYNNSSEFPPVVFELLNVMTEKQGFVDFIIGNSEALKRREKTFVTVIAGRDVRFLTRVYPEKSRHLLNHRLATILKKINASQGHDKCREVGGDLTSILEKYSLKRAFFPQDQHQKKPKL